MSRPFFLALLFSLGFSALASGQVPSSSNDSLAFWSDVMFNAGQPSHRLLAAVHAEDLFERLLADGSLDQSRLHPNIVRLDIPRYRAQFFSWQCEKENQSFGYYGFIVDSTGHPVKLTRELRNYGRIRNEEFDESNWYGAVYYHVLPVTFGPSGYCVLFGFAQNDQKEKFRIIELLDLADGRIRFGVPVLKAKDEEGEELSMRRQVVRYSASSNCVLRYEPEEKMIMYDHIIAYDDPMNPGVSNLYPDGSYEAFQYREGQWEYVAKLMTESLKSAPREKPVFDQQKDLFGRPKKK